VNRTLSSGVSTALAMIAILSCSDLPTEPNALELDDPSGDPAGLVASIEVKLASTSLSPGQTTQATVTVLNQYGDTITRVVSWSSSDSTVATVSSSGLVTAIAPGTAAIIASRRLRSGSAILTVTGGGTSVTAPGTVSDLSVSTIGSNSVTLSFTQVDDGIGNPASYDVRYAVAPISWGDASSTTSGTCTTPVAGTAIGSRLTCTVLGLSPTTSYNFQLVAFRGTLNVGAVFGGLSNIVSATTTAEAPPPPPPDTAPGRVSDLSVSAIGTNSVTLSFTQVNDGTGKPASYDVRYAVAPISWGDASSTTSGTCTTPVTGTAIGSRLTCTVLGLSSSTNYNFQLVAFRGTLNVSVVFGALSNIAAASTTGSTPPPPPPPTGSPEPEAGDAIIWQDNFNRATQAELVAPYNKRGVQQLITDGHSGQGIRFPYTASSWDNLIEKFFTSTTDIYFRYWYRLSPGADPTCGGRNDSGFKWFMPWRQFDPRYTMGVSNLRGGPVGFENTGLEFSSHDNSSSAEPNPFMQNINKTKTFRTTADGAWHEYTLHVVTGNGGYEQIWVDGLLVLDNSSYHYDHSAEGINMIQFPGTMVSWYSGCEFTVDVDDFVIWHK
jgi:hypothetical protein